ncbi:MAG: hypothetical protein HY300_04815 [Verrucomicrobia bacterium]|nr:hypothetical protein [Verrucomicrobiota bacterium]
MSDFPQTDLVRWSRNRWCVAVVFLFILQLVLVVMLAGPLPGAAVFRERGVTARIVLGAQANQQLLDSLGLADPALFVRVSRSGFSGAAWLNVSQQEYRLQEWTEPVPWMDRSTAHLGGAFQQFARTNRPPAVAIADKPVELPVASVAGASSAGNESSFRVEGPLRARPLVQTARPRSFTNNDVLADTVVQVLVNSDGQIFSPRLLTASVVKDPVQRAADQYALDLTREFRFQPLPKSAAPNSMTDGTLVFHWNTLAPASASKP